VRTETVSKLRFRSRVVRLFVRASSQRRNEGSALVGGKLVAALLMCQTTNIMDSIELSDDGHVETLRQTYETEDLGAIMGRFFSAVSWQDGGEE
jgi:hypothetical protein